MCPEIWVLIAVNRNLTHGEIIFLSIPKYPTSCALVAIYHEMLKVLHLKEKGKIVRIVATAIVECEELPPSLCQY